MEVNPDRLAFVDESIYRSSDGRETYLMAATLVAPEETAASTAEMLALRPGRVGNLHWSKEGATRQQLIVDRIAELALSHLVVVRSSPRRERPERQRRKCLEQLCCDLETLTVTRLVIESRGAADDRRDLATMQSLRAQRRLGPELRMRHERGPAQPLLWIADAVCGAYRSGGSRWEPLRTNTTVIELIEA